jgi:transposase-like protein
MGNHPRKADGQRVFSAEFKRTTVQRILTGEKTVAELSRELDIVPSVIRTWARRQRPRATPPGSAARRRSRPVSRARRDLDRAARRSHPRDSKARAAPSLAPVKSSPPTRAFALVREIVSKRQADVVMAAHRALTTHLRHDTEFAKRYPTLDLQPYRLGNQVGLRVGTRREAVERHNWQNIGVVLRLDQGVAPPGACRGAALWAAHDVLTAALIPRLLSVLPNVTRKDVVTLLRDAWPSTRGRRSTPMFDPQLVKAASKALARENPHWGARAIRKELAARLNVSVRTIANLIRKK